MTCTFASGLGVAAAMAVTVSIAGANLPCGVCADELFADRNQAIAESQSVTARRTTADVLKHEYLKCERAASEDRLDAVSAVRCSFLYEELRNRVFGGDFDALLVWWREAR